MFAAVMHRRLAFFDATRTGELLNRLSNDVTQVIRGWFREGHVVCLTLRYVD